MVRTSVTHVILFIAVVSTSTLFVGTLIGEFGLYAQSVEGEGERAVTEIDTRITLINDPEAGTTYDKDNETVTLYVKNVGGSTLEPDALDVLLDGEYVMPATKTIRGGDYWRPGRVLEVRLDHALDLGPHRAVVRQHGDEARLEFAVEPERLVWQTDEEWSAGTFERTVSDDIGDREADTVRLGYDAGTGGLVSYWPFDEDSGDTAVDATGSNDGSHVNDLTLGRTGLVGTTAYGFDGVDSRVAVTDDESLRFADNLTVSLWVNTTELGTSIEDNNQTYLLDKSDWDNKTGYVLGDNGNESDEVFFRVLGNDDHWDATIDRALVNDGEWHNIVAVHDGDEIRIYLDGTLQDTTANTTLEISDVDLGIGADRYDWGPFEGDLDEVQLYGRALNDTAVGDQYRTGINGTYTTGWETMQYDAETDTLQLENVSADLSGGTATVYVQSDTNGDGEMDEESQAIELTGNAEYAVDGLETDTDRFRLYIELEASNVTSTPVISQIELAEAGT